MYRTYSVYSHFNRFMFCSHIITTVHLDNLCAQVLNEQHIPIEQIFTFRYVLLSLLSSHHLLSLNSRNTFRSFLISCVRFTYLWLIMRTILINPFRLNYFKQEIANLSTAITNSSMQSVTTGGSESCCRQKQTIVRWRINEIDVFIWIIWSKSYLFVG